MYTAFSPNLINEDTLDFEMGCIRIAFLVTYHVFELSHCIRNFQDESQFSKGSNTGLVTRITCHTRRVLVSTGIMDPERTRITS